MKKSYLIEVDCANCALKAEEAAKKSADKLMRVPLYITCCFFLATFNILSLTCVILIARCLAWCFPLE